MDAPVTVPALTPAQVAGSLERLGPALEKYRWLQRTLHERDVSVDGEYQRRFSAFYRVRRNSEWRQSFFRTLQDKKGIGVSFPEALQILLAKTGRFEASFASKLVATVDPEQPVIDSIVLGFVHKRLPTLGAPNRFERLVDLHEWLRHWYRDLLGHEEGMAILGAFRQRYPAAADVTDTKAIDFVIWKHPQIAKPEEDPARVVPAGLAAPPVPASVPRSQEIPALSELTPMRAAGCLLGGALGDALGYPIEFWSRQEIERRFGSSPPRVLAYAGRPALVSDDTQMTLLTAEGLIRAVNRMTERGLCDPVACLHRAYVRWYWTQTREELPATSAENEPGWLVRQKELWHQRAPGNTCLNALGPHNHAWTPLYSLKNLPNNSKGCGAVMRSAPIGVVASSADEAFSMGRDAAALTHGHPSGYLSAAYLAVVVFACVRGVPLLQAMEIADGLLVAEAGHEEMAAILTRVRRLAERGPPAPAAIAELGQGWVGEEALGIGLLCALTVGGPSELAVADALWRAVAHDGDSDSTGSITGNLIGAMFGRECLPKAWVGEVELRDLIETVAGDLYAAAGRGYPYGGRSYPPN